MPTFEAPAVCVVDDDASLLRALKLLLRAAGFTVGAFGSAEEFLVAAHTGPPRCLVLDIHLGRLSGFELHERLMSTGMAIPTIFITAHDDAITRERARAGVAYLRKPFREDALLGAIREALESRGV